MSISQLTEIAEALFLNASEQGNRLRKSGKRIVHYTSAEVAANILQRKQVWLRNAIAMNDYSEIQYGEVCLQHAWQSEQGKRLQEILEAELPGARAEIESLHNRNQDRIRYNTYMVCMSEHESTEDLTGRLSMWRAYGGDNGVALVLHQNALFNASPGLGAYSSPVAYLTREEFSLQMGLVAEKLDLVRVQLKRNNREEVINLVLRALRFATLSTKHPGFREEQEWRVIYSPDAEQSPSLEKSVETINGVPQKVYKLALQGLALLDRVIIGPTKLPKTIRDTFVDILSDAGISDAESRVFNSDIPLRR